MLIEWNEENEKETTNEVIFERDKETKDCVQIGIALTPMATFLFYTDGHVEGKGNWPS